MKILIVKLTAIGDVVHGLPVLEAIKSQCPEAQIDWVVDRKALDVLRNHPLINDIHVFESKKWFKSGNCLSQLSEVLGFFRKIRERKYDAVLDLQGLLKSSAVAFLSGASRSIGFHRDDCREKASSFLICEHSSDSYKDFHVILRNLSPLTRLFPAFKPTLDYDFKLHLTEEERQKASDTLAGLGLPERKFFVVNPGGGWKTKLWFPERYAKVCKEISLEHGLSVLLVSGPGEEYLVSKIKEGCETAVIAPKTTIREMAAILERAKFILSPETGPLHIADSLGVPSVVLFGPSNITINRPVKSPSLAVMPEIDCGGCYKRTCPDPLCLDRITPQMVVERIRQLLERSEEKEIR